MPNWKKLIVSGSAGSLSSLTVDNNISANSISSSGAITGSDTYIDDWGSVSASLASISSSAISIPTLQQVTDQGTTTDNTIILDSNSADSPSIRFIDSSDITFNLYNDGGNIFTITRQDNGGADFRVVADSSNYTSSYIQVGNGSTYGKDATIVGDLTVQGTVTAQEFHTEFVSASIIYESGSTKFGDTQDDNHDFTGSLNVSGSINLPDNVKARFGNNYDLDIFHAGSDSYIDNKTGTLIIQNSLDDSDVSFRSDDGSGGVTEYFRLDGGDGNVQFAKNIKINDGADIYLADNGKTHYGNSNDLEVFHDSSNSYITAKGTGDLYIQQTTDDKDIIFQSDDGSGGVTDYLKIDGSATTVNFSKPAYFGDNIAAKFGNNYDLEITHNGTNSVISNDAGDLYLINTTDDKDIIFQSDDGSGGVTTYFQLDGSQTQTIFSQNGQFQDNVRLKLGSGGDLQILHTGTASTISNSTGTLTITNSADDEDILFRTDDGAGGVTDYLRLDGSTTNAYFSNPGNFGIGTTSPSYKLDVAGNANISSSLYVTGSVGIANSSPSYDLEIGKDGDGERDIRIHSDLSSAYFEINTRGNLTSLRANQNQNLRLVSEGGSGYLTISTGGNTERMRVNYNGNVGIGTTSPSYKLDLVGDLRVLSSSINYQENTDVDTGTETIATVNTGSFDGAFFDYLIKSGSNLRAGTVTAVHDGTNVEYNEVSTQDLGSTSVVELSVDISGADMRLRATTTSDDWLIKSLVRTL